MTPVVNLLLVCLFVYTLYYILKRRQKNKLPSEKLDTGDSFKLGQDNSAQNKENLQEMKGGSVRTVTISTTSPAPTNDSGKKRKVRFYWNASRDIQLLQALLEFKPWENGDTVYKDVVVKLKLPISERGYKLRVHHLIKAFKGKELATLRESGTEKEYTQREKLLEEIAALEEINKGGDDTSSETALEKELNAAVEPSNSRHRKGIKSTNPD